MSDEWDVDWYVCGVCYVRDVRILPFHSFGSCSGGDSGSLFYPVLLYSMDAVVCRFVGHDGSLKCWGDTERLVVVMIHSVGGGWWVVDDGSA